MGLPGTPEDAWATIVEQEHKRAPGDPVTDVRVKRGGDKATVTWGLGGGGASFAPETWTLIEGQWLMDDC